MNQPNVILINCDDLGYGDLACYGSNLNRTPHLDRLAAEGVRFTDFYASSPVCSPSRAALMTGSYPLRVGFGGKASGGLGGVLFPGWSVGLNPSEITIARALKDAGYATKLVGKWHLGDQPEFLPTNHGFDEYYGIPYSNDMGRQIEGDRVHGLTPEELEDMLRQMGLTEPWVRPPLPLVDANEDVIDVIEAQPDQASLTNRYLEQALRFIRRETSAQTPFFLYLAHMYVHLPIYVQERFKKASQNGDYGAAVECVDWVTGVILAELERLGIDDDTVVVFTSDNGALAVESGGSGSNAPLRGSKGSTWEGGQRVPGIIRWPGTIAPGEAHEVASQMDLYPTLANICGATVPADRIIDGHDLSPRLGLRSGEDEPDDERPFFYFAGPSIEAVRQGRWKLHVRKQGDDTIQLYDLESDIAEATDVADDHPDVVAELTTLIDEARADLGHEIAGIAGPGLRPIGKVDNPVTLTEFDPDHPYFMAEYDLADRG
ncbi:MAG: sulfatase [Acidimicrobiales bacterium]|nr:sulfatase [Acidimicrobiales bacterium]